jgi:hypothetical protein
MVTLDEIFNRVTQRRVTFHQNGLTFDNTHLDKTPAQGSNAIDAGDYGALTRLKEMQSD